MSLKSEMDHCARSTRVRHRWYGAEEEAAQKRLVILKSRMHLAGAGALVLDPRDFQT